MKGIIPADLTFSGKDGVMADEQQELRRVNWNEVFSVTHVFKSFRMAIHLSKLGLALAAVILIGLWGFVLDLVAGWGNVTVTDGEIYYHATMSEARFDDWQEKTEAARAGKVASLWIQAFEQQRSLSAYLTHLQTTTRGGGPTHFEETFAKLLAKANEGEQPKAPTLEKATEDATVAWTGTLGKAEALFDKEAGRIADLIDACDEEDAAWKAVEDDPALDTDEKKDEAREKLRSDIDAAWRALTRRKIAFGEQVRAIRGRSIFAAFVAFEDGCIDSAISAVRRGNLTGGLADYRAMISRRADPFAAPAAAEALASRPDWGSEKLGFLYWVLMGVHGFGWLFCQYWLFAIAFLAVALGIWAVFGGAIHRIAALHFAREEKISVTQALKFSCSKALSFYTAPLIPLALILVAGVLMALGGLILGNWDVSAVLMGVLFGLAVLGGLVIAFLMVGLLAGGWLMYPTIAVESSDSFDAISRSYSYVFSRPWRTAAYGLVALVYGVICYLFVRLFAYLVLCSTHYFVGWGVFAGGQSVAPTADKLDVIWPAPTYNNLIAWPTWEAMNGWEAVSGVLVLIWVLPIAGLVLAFLLSYCSSASTVIYFLLRRKVDATDLDDVYVEEPEEEPLAPVEPEAKEAEKEPAEAEEPEPAEEPSADEAESAKPKRTRKKAAKKAAKRAKKADEDKEPPQDSDES
jgi:hypothetical protein